MKKLCIIIAMILFGSNYLPAQETACTKVMNEGKVLFKSGKYADAKRKFEAARGIDCDKAQYWIDECNKKIAKKTPPPPPTVSAEEWYNKGEENYNAGNYSEAIDCYRKALEMKPSMLIAWNSLANAYIYQGKYTEAIDCYKKVETISPSADLWNSMGICYKYLQDYDNAMNCFQKSNNMEGLNELANICRTQGNYTKAIDAYNIVVAKRPSASVWNDIGYCYKQLKMYDNAIDCFEKSNSIDNSGGTAWYNMGLCYADKNKLSKSKECFKKAAKLGHKYAQELLTLKKDENSIATNEQKPFTPPEFPGGQAALQQWLKENLKYPEEAKKNEVQGKVVVSFYIWKSGKIDMVKVTQKINSALDKEAVRLVKAMPKWKPATKKGKAIEAEHDITISFRLDYSND